MAHYWGAQDSAAAAARPWLARGNSRLIVAAALCAAIVFFLLRLQTSMQLEASGTLARQQIAQAYSSLGGMLILLGALLICWLWMLQRFYLCAQLALAFLEPQPKNRQRRSLDDLLAVSSLSEQELLCGLLLHCLRRLLLPMLIFTASCAICVAFARGQAFLPDLIRYDSASLTDWFLLTAVILGALISGILGALNSILLLLSLGLSRRPSLLPLSGACAQALTQFAVGALMSAAILSSGPLASDAEPLPAFEVYSGVLAALFFTWLLGILALYLARRWSWLRFVLGHGILFPLFFVIGPLLAFELFAGDDPEGSATLVLGQIVMLIAYSLPSPLLFAAWLQGSGVFFLSLLLVLVPVQVLGILVLAGFARDAIQRRKWETQA